MGDIQGFLKHQRELPARRPVEDRLGDWREVYLPIAQETLKTQASRCMACGIPFCNNGCPLGNLIPDWNDLVYRDHWRAAIERLHATNNFPEFTGRLCPAPCEAACVLGINQDPVTIKQVEVEIIDRAWAEGTIFRAGVEVGTDLSVEQLRAEHDAVVLAGGSTTARDLPIPGRDLDGIHQAMEFLPWSNRAQEGDLEVADAPISAAGRRVVIIGGGDTGADCLGTSHRHGAASVHQFEIMPRPAGERSAANPWPTWPMVLRTSSAHEEGGERVFSVNTRAFLGDEAGRVRALQAHEVEFVDGRFQEVEGSDVELECDLVLLAMGFVGPEQDGRLAELGVALTDRGNVARDDDYATSVAGVWVCGDMGRGQSLIVWAIAEGRACAAAVDASLMGASALPVPIPASARPLV